MAVAIYAILTAYAKKYNTETRLKKLISASCSIKNPAFKAMQPEIYITFLKSNNKFIAFYMEFFYNKYKSKAQRTIKNIRKG